jgi:membrane protease YdiL (CAAX protease family)
LLLGGGLTRALLALLFAMMASVLVLLWRDTIFGALIGWVGASGGTDAALDACYRIAIYGTILLLALLGLALFRIAPRAGGGGKPCAAAFGAGVGAIVVLLGIAFAAGVAVPASPFIPPSHWGLLAAGTALVGLQAAAEELMFRGLLQPILIRACGWRTGIVVTALGFAAVHVAGGWRDPVSLANVFLAGAWFGLLAWRTGGVLAPMLAHFGYNAAEEMLFAASPNPGHGAFGSIFDVDLAGPAIWGGSVEGLNASLVLSAVLILLIVPLVAVRAKPALPAAAA